MPSRKKARQGSLQRSYIMMILSRLSITPLNRSYSVALSFSLTSCLNCPPWRKVIRIRLAKNCPRWHSKQWLDCKIEIRPSLQDLSLSQLKIRWGEFLRLMGFLILLYPINKHSKTTMIMTSSLFKEQSLKTKAFKFNTCKPPKNLTLAQSIPLQTKHYKVSWSSSKVQSWANLRCHLYAKGPQLHPSHRETSRLLLKIIPSQVQDG